MSRSNQVFLFALASLLAQAEAAAGGVTGVNIMIIFVVGLVVLAMLGCGYHLMCKPKTAKEMIGPYSGVYELHADHKEGQQVQIPVGAEMIGFKCPPGGLEKGKKVWIEVDTSVIQKYEEPEKGEVEGAEDKIELGNMEPQEAGILGIFTWL